MIDPSAEAGKFAGGFVVTVVKDVVDGILGRSHKNDRDVAESARELHRLIQLADRYKALHKFAHDFIDERCTTLFGDPKNKMSAENTLDNLKQTWEIHYNRRFSTNVNFAREEAERLRGDGLDPKQTIDDLESENKLDIYTRRRLTQLPTHTGQLITTTQSFCDNLDLIAEQLQKDGKDGISGKDLENLRLGETHSTTHHAAKSMLRDADEALVTMLQVLSYLSGRIFNNG
jgi:hypothetical protein